MPDPASSDLVREISINGIQNKGSRANAVTEQEREHWGTGHFTLRDISAITGGYTLINMYFFIQTETNTY